MSDESGRYEMSYPCYFAMYEDGDRFRMVDVDGHPCVVLLTDEDAVEAFFRDQHRGRTPFPVTVRQAEGPDALLAELRSVRQVTVDGGRPVQHVALDPYRGKAGYTALAEFIEHLEHDPG